MHQRSNGCDGYRIKRQSTSFRQQKFISYFIMIASSHIRSSSNREKFSTGCFGCGAQGPKNYSTAKLKFRPELESATKCEAAPRRVVMVSCSG